MLRKILQFFGLMGKERDNDERDQLAGAICDLTCAVREATEQRRADLATKCDLLDVKRDILQAIKAAGTDSAGIKKATEDLGASTDALQNAVNENK